VIPIQRKKTRPPPPRRLHIVVTAGPTREHFDPVRFLSNPSTGKMGYAIAEAAARRGHRCTLVSGPVELRAPDGTAVIRVTTAAEMAKATKRAFKDADAAILTAAVCDYRPRRQARQKLAKKARTKRVDLVPTEDIAAALGRRKGRRITMAFALEDHNGRAKAERKMCRKNCDAIVLNGPGNVGSGRATVELLLRGAKWERWRSSTKRQIAERLVRRLESMVRRSRVQPMGQMTHPTGQ